MRTGFFKRFDPLRAGNEKFASDLATLLSLSHEDQMRVVDGATKGSMLLHGQAEHANSIVSQASNELAARQAYGFVQWWQTEVLEWELFDDQPKEWAADLVDSDVITEDQIDAFVSCATALVAGIAELRQYKRARAYEIGVLPSLKGFAATVELRGVFESPHEMGDTDYEPKLTGALPIISVMVRTNQDNGSRFYFQATQEELRLLIIRLEATLKQAAELGSLAKVTAEDVG